MAQGKLTVTILYFAPQVKLAVFLYGTQNAVNSPFFQRPSGRVLFSAEAAIEAGQGRALGAASRIFSRR